MGDITTTLSANNLIVQALQALRVVTEFAPISGYYEQVGMQLLNEILQDLNSSSSGLPFYYTLPFNLVAAKRQYLFGLTADADVIMPYPQDIAYINIFYAGLKYPVVIINDDIALSSTINITLSFLPAQARVFEQQDALGNTFTILDFLYAPDLDYQAEIRYKPTLIDLNVMDIITLFPHYYHSYLRLELAYRILPLTGKDDAWTAQLDDQYRKAEQQMLSANKTDMSVKVSDALLNSNSRYAATRLGVRSAI